MIGGTQYWKRTDVIKETKSDSAKMQTSADPRVLMVYQYTVSISWTEGRDCAWLSGSIPNCSEI